MTHHLTVVPDPGAPTEEVSPARRLYERMEGLWPLMSPADFEGRTVTVPLFDLIDLWHAYAATLDDLDPDLRETSLLDMFAPTITTALDTPPDAA